MPKKKQPRNAFYFYAQDFKEEQQKKGIHYENLAEIMSAAGPSWTQLPPSRRAQYEAQAKAEKQKYNVPEMKFTSTGVPFSEIERQERERREAEQAERQDISNFVKLKSFNNSILDEDIYVMDVNYYCKVGMEYLIAECTVLRFSIREGIKDHYHEIINPGRIPIGYASDVKLSCEELGLDMPEEGQAANRAQTLATIVDFLQQTRRPPLPPLYTLPEKVAPVADFLHQMCIAAAEDDSVFRVYKLDILLFALSSALRQRVEQGLPKESLALAYLRKDTFKYTLGVTSCEHHQAGEKAIECTLSRAQRWAYAMLDSLCPLAEIQMISGTHLPPHTDIEGIITYKEERQAAGGRVRAGAGAGEGGVPPSDSGSVSAMSLTHHTQRLTLNTSDASSRPDSSRSTRFTDVDMRMPRTRPSQMSRAPPLTESEFPALAAPGRGRGLAVSRRARQVAAVTPNNI